MTIIRISAQSVKVCLQFAQFLFEAWHDEHLPDTDMFSAYMSFQGTISTSLASF